MEAMLSMYKLPAREVQLSNMPDELELLWVEVSNMWHHRWSRSGLRRGSLPSLQAHLPNLLPPRCIRNVDGNLLPGEWRSSYDPRRRLQQPRHLGRVRPHRFAPTSALVTDPTRGKNTLDMLMISKPGLYTVKVITSPI